MIGSRFFLPLAAALLVLAGGASFAAAPTTHTAVMKSEWVYPLQGRPTPQCHASTILALEDGGLVAAWFGGTREKAPDVGIWVARNEGSGWSTPVEVANGVQPDGTRLPCWNPVLFQPKGAPVRLYFKVGPTPGEWWGERVISKDGGKTWPTREKLPNGGIGPVKNKPVQLADGTILCPSSDESGGKWRVHIELTRDMGKTWEKIGPLPGCDELPSIQPSILVHPDGKLQLLCRTKKKVIGQSWSEDGGRTWSPIAATALPNPNSGIDAVTLKDGRHLLIYNPVTSGRSPLALAVSKDGKEWKNVMTLEDTPKKEFSYPAIIQAKDGLVHISYTYMRLTVKHVVLDPSKID